MEAPEIAQAGAKAGEGTTGVPGGPECFEVIGGSEGTGSEGTVAQEGSRDQETMQNPPLSDEDSSSFRDSASFIDAASFTETVSFTDSASFTDSECGSHDLSYLVLPFRYCMDAELACLLLAPVAESLSPEVHREITVKGKNLHILLATEGSRLMDDSMEALLNRLSTVLPLLECSEP